jgi:hypothetical protein
MALGLVCGCAALQPGPPRPWPLPDPALAPFQGQVEQAVRVDGGGRSAEFLALVDCERGVVTLAGLSPQGQRLVKVRWDARGMAVEADPAVAAHFDGALALRDLVLARWPVAALQRSMQGSRWALRQTPDQGRTLSLDGRIVVAVSPDGGTVAHLQEGYRVTVRALPAE